jgi:beta-phosphoglucomutase-like phosphatase (HAD superfamily)
LCSISLHNKLTECLGISNPQLYKTASEWLSLPPSRVALVAAHPWDLRAAASQGLRTIYLRREDHVQSGEEKAAIPKADGGEFDVVVESLAELADQIAKSRGTSPNPTMANLGKRWSVTE